MGMVRFFCNELSFLFKKKGFKKIITNAGWMLVDKVVRMAGGAIVGIWSTRYLGPKDFGTWNYALAISGIFGAIASLGFEGVIVRDLVENPKDRDKLLGTAFALRFVASILTTILAITFAALLKPNAHSLILLVFICSLGSAFQSAYVIDLYFRSATSSKHSIIAQDSAFALSVIVKILLIVGKCSLLSFVVLGIAEQALAAVFLIFAYKKRVNSIREWKYSQATAIRLLSDSWPLIVSGLVISIYMRIDQIMLGKILGESAVGVYSAAVKVSEIWYFIPISILNSAFPTILKSKATNEIEYRNQLQYVATFLLWMSMFVALIMQYLSKPVITILYGSKFEGASSVLIIHIWTGVAVAIGCIWSQWILVEGKQKLSIINYVVTALINVILNLILIPKFGICGAAISTLSAYSIGQCTSFFLFKPSENYARLLKAFIPLYLLKTLKDRKNSNTEHV